MSWNTSSVPPWHWLQVFELLFESVRRPRIESTRADKKAAGRLVWVAGWPACSLGGGFSAFEGPDQAG